MHTPNTFIRIINICIKKTGPAYTGGLADGENGFLLALLLGSAGFLPIEPTQEDVDKYKKVAKVQKALAHKEMLWHKYLPDGK